jgi:4-diphosphocytidyl-2-C-methyl-D-erythritol kinase
MTETPWPAPAKLNLFLHVTGRRADGYHELETLFQLVDLADELVIRVRRDGVIARTGGVPGLSAAEDLMVRAASRLRQEAGDPALGAQIDCLKRIPVGAGLGGGSSDAATVLVALNRLWGIGLETARLARIGLELGADVPVFVRGVNALARGVGEQLEPVDLPPRAFAIVYPGAGVATAEAFQAPELTRNSRPITIAGSPTPSLDGTALPGRNDLEPVVAARHPAVRAALEWLGERGSARMTGSGASVFAAYSDRGAAEAALSGLPSGWTGFVVEGLNRSPLIARLAAERSAAGLEGSVGA